MEHYGGAGDWEILYTVKVRNAGDVEHAARSRLSQYATARSYWKDNVKQYATELLRCSFSRAREALEAESASAKVSEPWNRHFTAHYNFEEA